MQGGKIPQGLSWPVSIGAERLLRFSADMNLNHLSCLPDLLMHLADVIDQGGADD